MIKMQIHYLLVGGAYFTAVNNAEVLLLMLHLYVL